MFLNPAGLVNGTKGVEDYQQSNAQIKFQTAELNKINKKVETHKKDLERISTQLLAVQSQLKEAIVSNNADSAKSLSTKIAELQQEAVVGKAEIEELEKEGNEKVVKLKELSETATSRLAEGIVDYITIGGATAAMKAYAAVKEEITLTLDEAKKSFSRVADYWKSGDPGKQFASIGLGLWGAIKSGIELFSEGVNTTARTVGNWMGGIFDGW